MASGLSTEPAASGATSRAAASAKGISRALSWACAAAALAASTTGLAAPGAYDASAATTEMLRGFDLVLLAVVVPGLLLTLLARSPGADMVRLGLLGYTMYAALLASAVGGLGGALLIDVALLTAASGGVLTTLLGTLNTTGFHVRSRRAALPLALLSVSLAGMWVIAAVHGAATGQTPAGSLLVETELTVRLGIVLDLWLLVPLYGVAAALLWRGARGARELGYLALVSGLVHQAGYVSALMFQAGADIAGAPAFDPVEPVIIALYVAGLLALAAAERSQRTVRP